MRVYFDLCSEEYFLHIKGHLDNEAWNEWEKGMEDAFKKRAFKEAWTIITEKSIFYHEFKQFVESKMIKR